MLSVEPTPGLALLGTTGASIAFDGIALGPGLFVDAAERRIRIRADQLPAVASRMQGAFLRDLHREDIGASVGVVSAARVEQYEVRFTGDVRLQPYVDIIREFWPSIRFSLGFRFDPAELSANPDGSFDLPDGFLVDHLAIVPQGQYPNARLVRLLNQARSAPSPSIAETARSGTMPDDTNPDQLRQQRDDALTTATQRQQELELARAELGKARADLDAASKLAEAARLELGQAKNRLAAEVMKLELGAGKDFDLDQRKKELTGLDLGSLDKLRGDLRLAAKPPEPLPPTPATAAGKPEATPAAQPLDLARLPLGATLRLAFEQGVL
ncbi:MAG: hypothetical protein LC792_15420 [Actinobacteria bacterium]|nr:hypothetical protein [Actinomycetota bacterium]